MLLLTTRRQQLWHLAFSPDGSRLAAAGDISGCCWSALAEEAAPHELAASTKRRPVRYLGLGFAADGEYLFTSRSSIGVSLLRLKTGSARSLTTEGSYVCVEPSPTEPLVLVADLLRGRLRCRRITANGPLRRVWTIDPKTEYPGGPPTFAPDGSWFAYPTTRQPLSIGSRIISIRRTESGRLIRRIETPDEQTGKLAISPDGRWIAYCSMSVLGILNTASPGEPPLRLRNESRKYFTAVAFHPSGRYLAAASNDATVKLYDTTSWQVAKTYTWDVGKMRSVAFSPDGTLAAAGSDTGKVVVWDVDA